MQYKLDNFKKLDLEKVSTRKLPNHKQLDTRAYESQEWIELDMETT
jgi:hypothetical protein